MYHLLLWLSITTITLVNTATPQCEDMCSSEVRRFQELVTINTTIGADFTSVVDFWRRLAKEENVQFQVYEYVKGYPVMIMKYPGLDSSLSSIMLNGHVDVVPANYKDGWTYSPLSGAINNQCEVVGRGTQDMKATTIQYFEAMNRLTNNNVTLLRDVYIVLTSDEVTGSMKGEALFVKSQEFQDMNVGFAFDVGVPNPDPAVIIFYQDKSFYGLRVDCYGQSTGSGIFLKQNITAEGACVKFYQSYMKYKKSEYQKFLKNQDFAKYTLINFVGECNRMIYAATPSHMTMYYSITLDRRTSLEEFNETLKEWAREAGGNIKLTTELQIEKSPPTKIDNSNPYWVALKDVFDELNIPLKPQSMPIPADENFIARAGIPTLGMSPQPNTPLLVFSTNERLSINIFLEGICIYEQVIERLANLPDSQVGDDPRMYLDYSDE